MNYGTNQDDSDFNVRTHVEEIGRGHGPEAAARADEIRNRTESTTPAGLMNHALRMHDQMIATAQRVAADIIAKAQAHADKMMEDAKTWSEHQRSEQRASAHTTGELIASQLSHVQMLGQVTEKLRQPVERSPTAAEVAGDVVKTVATLFQGVLLKNPRLLEGAAERFNASVQGAAAGSAASADPVGPDAAAEADFAALKLSELKGLFAELPEDFIASFAAERQLRSFDDVTIGDVRALFTELRTRRASAGAGTVPDPGHA